MAEQKFGVSFTGILYVLCFKSNRIHNYSGQQDYSEFDACFQLLLLCECVCVRECLVLLSVTATRHGEVNL
jgi:hypothetical protein